MKKLLLASILLGCRGADVEQASDASSDTTAVDAAPDGATDGAADAGDAAGCSLSPNLVPNGDFMDGTSGWSIDAAKVDIVAGPCGGKAARLWDVHSYGSITRPITLGAKKGQRVRIRAFFRASGTLAASTPFAWCGFPPLADGGEGPEVKISATGLTSDWKQFDASMILAEDATGCTIVLASGRSDPDEFAVGQVSFTVE